MNEAHTTEILRKIPAVDRLLQDLSSSEAWPRLWLVQEIRLYLGGLRSRILTHDSVIPEIADGKLCYDGLLQCLKERLLLASQTKVCKALNATGVILHTGLGRAPLPESAIANICRNLRGYTVLEVSRETGERSHRDLALKDLLCSLTGAEDATVANNNAGAVLLVLAALARGKEVIVSRGQLVEIGGSFRIPEVMKESGAHLVEVGCTNRTYVADYHKAVSANTAALLHVHTSNFKVLGFTHEATLEELATLAREKNLCLIQDAGSGAIANLFPSWSVLAGEGQMEEPVIAESIAKGADIVTFSGDKLLGACQAGIIVGKHSLIEKIRKHPLARALRVDKVTFSVLESTLRHYQNLPTCVHHIPALRMMGAGADEIQIRAGKIAASLKNRVPFCDVEVVPAAAKAGSGAFPVQEIPSYAVSLKSSVLNVAILAKLLRLHHPPVFGRVQSDTLFLDPRTLLLDEDEEVVEIVSEVAQSAK